MIKPRSRNLAWAGAGAGVLTYQILAHRLTASPSALPWEAIVAFAPFAALSLWYGRRSRRIRLTLVLWILLVVVAVVNWTAIGAHLEWVYFIPHVSINALMCLAFGLSLERGRVPMCTQLAAVVHDTLSPRITRYTRQVTLAWTVFFGAMTVASTLLFFLSSVDVWSVFANLLTLPLVALMFVAEYLVRTRTLPPEDCPSVLATARAYLSRRATTRPWPRCGEAEPYRGHRAVAGYGIYGLPECGRQVPIVQPSRDSGGRDVAGHGS